MSTYLDREALMLDLKHVAIGVQRGHVFYDTANPDVPVAYRFTEAGVPMDPEERAHIEADSVVPVTYSPMSPVQALIKLTEMQNAEGAN